MSKGTEATNFRLRRLALVLNSGVAMLAAPALALAQGNGTQADNKAGIEEIVVTAQRREESLQDVPIAITAFTTEELERRNISSALDLVQYVPNFVGHNNTGLATANAYYIRGVGDTESLASKDPPVGTYVDDLFFSRQSANNFSFFDVERVEVLRGPQGTLFGRNTTGGAINVIVRKPQDRVGGFAEIGYGSFDQVTARASVDLPITSTVLTKISGYYSDDNGYVKNITTGETLNDEQGYGGRLAFRILDDAFGWDGAVTLMHAAGANLINFDCNPANPTDCDGRFASTGLRKNNGGATQYPTIAVAKGKGANPLGNVTDTIIAASNFEFDFGEAATLNLISGYISTEQSYNLDFFDGRAAPGFTFVNDPSTGRPTADSNLSPNTIAGGPVRGRAGGFAIAADTLSTQFTQEIKLTGRLFDGLIDYVGGFYYYDENNFSDFADIVTSTSAAAPTTTLLADRVLRNGTEALAGYLQVDANVTPWLKLTAGVRYTDEKKEYDFSDNRAACRVNPLPATCIDSRNFASVDNDLNPATPNIAIPLTQRIKIWTPRFAVNVKPNDDILLFASATRGFKSGGQSARSTSVRFLLPFGPEKVWSYEVGAKMDLLDRRLRVNVTGFHADTADLQGGSAFITTNLTTGAQTLSFVTRNFGDFRNQGVEFEITAIPVPGLTLNLSGGYQDARYILDPGRVDFYGTLSATAQRAECLAALAGRVSPRADTRTAAARAQSSCGNGIITPTGEIAKPPRTPKFSVAAGASYELDAGPVIITPSVNVLYTSSQEVGSSNTSFYRTSAGVINVRGEGEFVTGSYSRRHAVVNASLGIANVAKDWNASIECSNCLDVAYPQSTLSNFSYLNQPATWMVKLRHKW
jgi:iron complex outermembrane recepter protein